MIVGGLMHMEGHWTTIRGNWLNLHFLCVAGDQAQVSNFQDNSALLWSFMGSISGTHLKGGTKDIAVFSQTFVLSLCDEHGLFVVSLNFFSAVVFCFIRQSFLSTESLSLHVRINMESHFRSQIKQPSCEFVVVFVLVFHHFHQWGGMVVVWVPHKYGLCGREQCCTSIFFVWMALREKRDKF